MAMFDDLAAQYTALPSWAQIGIPVAGLGGIAYIALHKGSGGTAVVSGPGVSAGASNGGGGGNSSSGGSAPPISSDPGGGGTPQSQPGPTAPPINFLGPPTSGMYNPSAETPGTPQYNALTNPDKPYLIAGQGGNLQTFTPNSAVQWWNDYLAHPFDLYTAAPGSLPGSLVLSSAQAQQIMAVEAQYTGTGKTADPSAFSGFTIAPNPYTNTSGNTNVATTASSGGTAANSPGPTNYSAANATLYKDIQIYQNVANPTAKQKAALATDLATYRRQGGVLP